jgi:hypothetical protein
MSRCACVVDAQASISRSTQDTVGVSPTTSGL